METTKRMLVAEHPDNLLSKEKLAFTWKAQSRYDDATTLDELC
jgi:hypothetical protein